MRHSCSTTILLVARLAGYMKCTYIPTKITVQNIGNVPRYLEQFICSANNVFEINLFQIRGILFLLDISTVKYIDQENSLAPTL